ncbi:MULTISPECIES: dephospho-CoA kinase [unclassified Pseudoalteromonas]|uniref:dephospho-CoA kinase n=1 Tax=unclassified Pseudoalteromonas TaxID=194690 RepID=UPI0030155D70
MLETNNWILGLTGGIGAGKTAVSDYLAQQGIVIVDADVVAREVVEPGSEALEAIKAEFGEQVIQADGGLNRAKLRQLIFADDNKKRWLNNLLHPRIRESLLSQLQQANSEYVVLSAPLLFENGLEKYCDATLLVDVPVAVQISRTSSRDGVDKTQVESIIAAQMSREEKQQKADYILNNDRELTQTLAELEQLNKKFKTLAKAKSNTL